MKVIAINGSPRVNGNTAIALKAMKLAQICGSVSKSSIALRCPMCGGSGGARPRS